MSIVARICEKYKNNYNVVSDGSLEPVCLEYGANVPADFRNRVERFLDRVDVEFGPYEYFLQLKLELDDEGNYRLSRSGELLYRFANKAPGDLYFPNYDVAETVAWTIYAIVSRNEKNCLSDGNHNITHGAYVSCESFSAKQQAVAARILKSVSAQNVNELPAGKLDAVLKQLLVHADRFTKSVPLFSGRPIPEAAFREYRGKSVEKKLGDIAVALFGNDSFETEMTSYREFVMQSEDYRAQVTKARVELMRVIYDLPIMAVDLFFTNLNDSILTMNTVSMQSVQELLDKTVRFTLKADKLKTAFAEVDSVCLDYLRNVIRQDFLMQVLDETMQNMDGEHLRARRACRSMKRELMRFCFVEENTFDAGEEVRMLSWKQLLDLQDGDLSMLRDIQWSAKTMISLQRQFQERPNCWFCASRLREESNTIQMNDLFNAVAVPLTDQRCIVALWVRANG